MGHVEHYPSVHKFFGTVPVVDGNQFNSYFEINILVRSFPIKECVS